MEQIGIAKAFLQKSVDGKTNLYDHLSEVLLKVLQEQPSNALEKFETLSIAAKQAKYHPADVPEPLQAPVLSSEDVQRAKDNLKLFKVAGPDRHPSELEEDAPQESDPAEINECNVPNFIEEASLFEAVGFGFGREEIFRLALSIKRQLADDINLKLKSVRLFGKFLGISNDYIVVESELKEPEVGEDSELPPNVVPPEKNIGTNKYVYWVCKYVGGPWTRLPDVTPQQVVVARQIKKFFSGDLDAKVSAYPPFPGLEKHYLRAQISRIAAATVLQPKGKFVMSEPEEEDVAPEMIESEEWQALTAAEQASAENWVHYYEPIREQGRVEKWIPPVVEKEEGEEGEEGEEEQEPEEEPVEDTEVVPPLLTATNEDTPINEIPAWSARIAPSFAPQYAVTSLRSVRWPGAIAVCQGKKSACMYIGYGHKYTGQTYTPPPPPPVQLEVNEEQFNMQTDPTVEEEDAFNEAQQAQKENENEEEGQGEEEEDAD
mmetsp:Transcript_42926/g.69646  ORF Transcript_42926/g.69646 Transcript_42926/m.69646 type:complete len:489 (-) Transcript_42926:388-1854(-)